MSLYTGGDLIFKILYGNFSIIKKTDFIIIFGKLIYVIATLPFFILYIVVQIRTQGAYKLEKNNEIGSIKRILLHVTATIFSAFMWLIGFVAYSVYVLE